MTIIIELQNSSITDALVSTLMNCFVDSLKCLPFKIILWLVHKIYLRIKHVPNILQFLLWFISKNFQCWMVLLFFAGWLALVFDEEFHIAQVSAIYRLLLKTYLLERESTWHENNKFFFMKAMTIKILYTSFWRVKFVDIWNYKSVVNKLFRYLMCAKLKK